MPEQLQGVTDTAGPAEKLALDSLALLQKVSDQTATLVQIAPGLAYMKILMVNICFISHSDAAGWFLVDAGLPGAAASIDAAARQLYGPGAWPAAIILTHGHFDHVGALDELIEKWDVPVYAHTDELPFLTGRQDYPPADPSASDGLLAKISPLYPRRAINLGDRVRPLPAEGAIPGLPGWRWLPTPGHTPGHIALFRTADKVLIAGDAFTTVEQESAVAVLRQEKEIHGPPAYFTPDWRQAANSVRRLAALNPSLAVTGHGLPLAGKELDTHLDKLARDFVHLALPHHARHV